MLPQLKALLWKILWIRKRHWILTLFECVVPTLLFLVMAFARSKVDGLNKTYVNETKFHEVHGINDIYSHLDIGSLKLVYAPYNDSTNDLIRRVQEKLSIPGDVVTEFDSKETLLLETKFEEGSTIAAVVFNHLDETGLDYDLTIYDKYLDWNTDKLYKTTFSVDEQKVPCYLAKGFAALQIAIDTSFMELLKPDLSDNFTFTLQQFPDLPHIEDAKLNQLFVHFLPAITVFSFILLCPSVLKRVSEEKTSGIKEMMKMVGVKSSQIWFSWFVYTLITTLISIGVIVAIMKTPLWGVSYSLIEHSDGSVLFTFLFLYCMAGITFCFLMVHISEDPCLATVFGVVFWLVSYFLPQAIFSSLDFCLWRFKAIFGVLPNMALYYGYSSISVYEKREIGIQWNNLFEPGSGDDQDVTMGHVFIMLILDTIAFLVLAVYLDNVKPGKYGIPKSLLYPLEGLFKGLKQCFVCKKSKDPEDPESGESLTDRKVKIRISNLKKIYSTYVAVEDLDMEIHANNITVLLGENGAGKTTTMSILTGMINATSGSVIIGDHDMRSHRDEARKSMGLCPQHNLLFHDLTVYEHLYFFAMLKGLSNIAQKIQEVLQQLGIASEKNSLPHTLSGGMKRKLCLAIALIGNSEILILDEPTSGMDPESKRQVWNMLSKYKQSKTVLISTHSMEEAEALGDRIIIMANGKLQCEGTPAELKTRYDTGYNLSLALESKNSVCSIRQKVVEHFPTARVKQETDDSVVYHLPFDQGDRYSELIRVLERYEEITDININATSITDVFLKAKDENDGIVKETGYRLCLLLKSKEKTHEIRQIITDEFPAVKVLREFDDSLVYFLPTDCRAKDKIKGLVNKLEEKQEELEIISVTVNVTTSKIDNIYTESQNSYQFCLLLKSRRFITAIAKTMKEYFPNGNQTQESKNFVLYSLPSSEDIYKYKKLITTFERKKDDWDIFSINMGITTPKGIVLKFVDDLTTGDIDYANTSEGSSRAKLQGFSNFFTLIKKRLIILSRIYPEFLLSVLITTSIFFFAIILTMSNSNISGYSGPPLELSLSAYGKPKVYFGVTSSDTFTRNLSKLFEESVSRGGGNAMQQPNVSTAIVNEGLTNLVFYKEHMITAAELDLTAKQVILNALFSSDALHGIPISINLAMNTIVKTFNENITINIRNAPLTPQDSQINPSELSVLNVSSIWVTFIPLCLFLLGSLFIKFPHLEVSTNFIKLQTNAGVGTWFYWFTNLFVDYILSGLSLALLVVVLYSLNWLAFNSNGFGDKDIWAFATIFGVYLITSLPFTYLFSYYKKLSEGITLFFVFGIFIGIVPTLIITAFEVLEKDHDKQILDFVRKTLTILSPQFALSNLSVKFSRKYVENFNWKFMEPSTKSHLCRVDREGVLKPCCIDPWSTSCEKYESYFENETFGIGEDLLFMVGTFAIYFFILLVKNAPDLMITFSDFFQIKRYLEYIFSSTKEIEKGKKVFCVEDLTKTYGKKSIVNGLEFDIHKGRCFGLLGVNGAGKTTTFRMITNSLMSTKGDIKFPSKDTNQIGYCPQEDSLNFLLTGRQLLNTMGAIKGLSKTKAEKEIDYLLQTSGLMKHADKPCYQYSGGNKRKLNTCIAFLASPKLTFLDEPTSGVDPSSQRKFWKMLSTFKRRFGSSFLLCSHSMEECESLCDWVAIMKNGEFNKEGSPVALKTKYQDEVDGHVYSKYKVTANLREKSFSEEVKQCFEESNFKLTHDYGTTHVYESNQPLSKIFAFLEKEKQKEEPLLDNFLINSLSIEDVFLQVAQPEEKSDENSTNSSKWCCCRHVIC